jgi:hypothetical protein
VSCASVLERVLLRHRLALGLLSLLGASAGHASPSTCGRVRADIATLRSAVKMYQIDHDGQLPHNGLHVLVSSGLIDSPIALVDPWGGSYVLVSRGDDFEVVTSGPDHLHGTADDFSGPLSLQCPPWPAPNSNRRLIVVTLSALTALSVGLGGRALARRRTVRLPRTTLN